MTTAPTAAFEPPDTIAALPLRPFEFSPAAVQEAGPIIAQEPAALFRRLLRDQESEATLLVARRVIDALLKPHIAAPAAGLPADAGADDIAAHVAKARASLAASIGSLADIEPGARDAVVRQRAPLSLLGGCWLDVLSQP